MSVSSENVSVSCFTACMNRNENLAIAIKSWFACSDIKEIVIVDWSSTIPVIDTIKTVLQTISFKTLPAIKIIEVQKQSKWVLSWAFNLASNFTTSRNILKLDCDYVIEPDFIKHHPLSSNTFYSGNWQNARNSNESYLNGCLYVKKDDFMKVYGYNEYIQRYGYDDSDLYERLTKHGLKNLYVDNTYINHLSHGKQSSNTYNDIHFNRFLIAKLPWGGGKTPSMGKFIYTSRNEVINFVHITVFTGISKDYVKIPLEIELEVEKELQNYIQLINRMKISPPKKPSENVILYSTTNKTTNTLYVNVRNGLGNKLRAFASAYTLMVHLNKTPEYNRWKWNLIIIWVPDEHCMAKYSSLFNHTIPNTIIVDTLPVISSDTVKLLTSNLSDEKDNPVDYEVKSFLEQIKISKSPLEAYLESATVIHFPHSNWKDDCLFLRSLKLSIPVQTLVNKTISDVETFTKTTISQLIGVHIRVGQSNQSFDNISSWPKDKQDQWNKWRKESNVDRFIIAMKKELSNCKGFYVASDTESVYTKLQSTFPGKIFFLKRDVWDRSEKQVVTGLVDVLILGKTKKLYASQWSSFSESVKKFSDLPMVLAGVDF